MNIFIYLKNWWRNKRRYQKAEIKHLKRGNWVFNSSKSGFYVRNIQEKNEFHFFITSAGWVTLKYKNKSGVHYKVISSEGHHMIGSAGIICYRDIIDKIQKKEHKKNVEATR